MAKVSVTTIQGAYASTSELNANFQALATAFENTVSRDGTTPNAMDADLDMGGNDLLNVGDITAGGVTVNGVDMTVQAAASEASADASAASESASAASESAAAASAAAAAASETSLVAIVGSISPTVHDAATGGNAATMGAATGGHFSRIGDLVVVHGTVELSSKGSMTAGNQVHIRGLPYNVKAGNHAAGVISEGSFLSLPAGTPVGTTAQATSKVATLVKFTLPSGHTGFLVSNLTSTSFLRFSFTYITDDA